MEQVADGNVGTTEHTLVLAYHCAVEPHAAFVGHAFEDKQRVGQATVVLERAFQSPPLVRALLGDGVVTPEARVGNDRCGHEGRVDAARYLRADTDTLTVGKCPLA